MALLLQRSVEQALAEGGRPTTAAAATRTLKTCHLNRVKPEGAAPYYTVTAPTVEQRELLVALDMEHLVDDEALEDVLRPR